MNCDECKEQVFELIDREADDPDGVREVLARCPDCRALFDEMKAALAAASQLPMEEPSAVVEAALVRAAGERVRRAVPLRKRRLQAPPWAMAAIAVLAVGVGVWAIPRDVQLEGEVAPADLKGTEENVVARQNLAEATATRDADGALAEVATLGSERTAPVRSAPPAEAEAKSKKASPRPAPAKRRSRLAADKEEDAPIARAPATLPASDVAAGGAGTSRSYAAAPEASAALEQTQDDSGDTAAACRQKVDELELRIRTHKNDAPTAEEELAIGRCYQRLDNVVEARKWLQRAATHRKTKARAEAALRALAPE